MKINYKKFMTIPELVYANTANIKDLYMNTPTMEQIKTYIDSQVALKADKTYVDTQLALKADKTYVDTQLDLKADKATTYLKTEVYTKTEVNDQIIKKGIYRGTFATTADRDTAIPTPNGGDITLIGTTSPYQEQIYDNATSTWEIGGTANTPTDLTDYYKKEEVDAKFIPNETTAQTEQQLIGYGLDGKKILLGVSAILGKVIYKMGQYVAFPTTFTPNPLLWAPAGTTTGDTLIEGVSEGRSKGLIRMSGGNNSNIIGYSTPTNILKTPNTGTEFVPKVYVTTTGASLVSDLNINFSGTGTNGNFASGINVKWYKAIKDITLGDL